MILNTKSERWRISSEFRESIIQRRVLALLNPVCVVGSLANPEIDTVSKGCSNAPILFHIGYHYENTIIKIAVARSHDAIRPANCSEYHAWHFHILPYYMASGKEINFYVIYFN